MKVYSSDTDQSPNGRATSPADDEPDDDDFAGSEYDYSALFDAPSYADFIKTAPNAKSRSYERRVASMMKAGLVMALNNHQWADAATFLKHGPGFSKAAGNLAAEDPRAAALVDMLTAPESPYVMFALVAVPLVSQLFRNHQPEFKAAGATWKERRAERKQAKMSSGQPRAAVPPITVRIFRREFKIPIRVRLRLPRLQNIFKAFLVPTQYPNEIAAEVFNDESVIRALHKMGIYPRQEPEQ